MRNSVVLVNSDDQVIGHADKLEAHRSGLLHRAFSIFTLNSKGEILLQKRAHEKYHSPGLWSNTCCSHPQPEEAILASAQSRLLEEMGFEADLHFVEKFHYQVTFENGLTENEIDYVFVGKYDGVVHPNSEEVADYQWVSPDKLLQLIKERPEEFTYWLPKALELALQRYPV